MEDDSTKCKEKAENFQAGKRFLYLKGSTASWLLNKQSELNRNT